MKIMHLEIKKFRGIPDLTLDPQGGNFLVWGPNGTGKSGVVDALDFLLTGRISRLVGEGTGSITLERHGSHVDADPSEAIVTASVKLPTLDEPITISRCVANPGHLEYNSAVHDHLKPILDISRRGQNVLSRREILKFITAKPGDRAEGIQTLLNITEIETIRRGLVSARTTLINETKSAKKVFASQQERVNTTTNQSTFMEDLVLKSVNDARAILSGDAQTELLARKLKAGLLRHHSSKDNQNSDLALVDRDIASIERVLSDKSQEELQKKLEQLQRRLQQVFAEAGLLLAVKKRELTTLGLKLLDDTGACPLCDLPWEEGTLKTYLKERLSQADLGEQLASEIEELCDEISLIASTLANSVKKIAEAVVIVDLKTEQEKLQNWNQQLQDFLKWLDKPFERPQHKYHDVKTACRLLAPDDVTELFSTIKAAIEVKLPHVTEEQTAWDFLTRLEGDLDALEDAQLKLEQANAASQRGDILLAAFETARDETLESLYNQINGRFSTLYRELHGEDEKDFNSTLQPDGAGLNFEVDFYGRGHHPPHALHSEGHQDSMGLCLYLSLTEELTKGIIDLTILDDVLMSVDAQHRRQVINILNTHFRERQFLITTHDKTWARELRHSELIKSTGFVEFGRWSVDTGPVVHTDRDIWSRIEQALVDSDVNEAAFQLRAGSEHYFEMVCDRLGAKVAYNSRGEWSLGDFLPAAQSEFKKLIKKGKDAAQSWKNDEAFEYLQKLDSVAKQIFTRVNSEQWSVNPNIHYNSWANFSETEFRPVVEAFHDLFLFFQCGKCGTLFEVLPRNNPEVVKCSCGKGNWSLNKSS